MRKVSDDTEHGRPRGDPSWWPSLSKAGLPGAAARTRSQVRGLPFLCRFPGSSRLGRACEELCVWDHGAGHPQNSSAP